MTTKKLAYTKRIDFKTTEEQVEKLERICELCNLTKAEVYRRLLDLAATVTSTKELFLVRRLQNELNHNQFIVTLTDEELEAINNYAEPLSLRNSTAIKQLAMQALEEYGEVYKKLANN